MVQLLSLCGLLKSTIFVILDGISPDQAIIRISSSSYIPFNGLFKLKIVVSPHVLELFVVKEVCALCFG